MVGSNRQCNRLDKKNSKSNVTHSFYYELSKLASRLSESRQLNATVEVDTYLLSDTYGREKPGVNFQKSLDDVVKGLFNEGSKGYSEFDIFDESKITIVYAQAHRIASLNPTSKIVYDFYDDKDSILKDIKEFYTANTDLIPENVVVRLHKYVGEEIGDPVVIQGTGFIDYGYQASILELKKTFEERKILLTQEDGYGGQIPKKMEIKTELTKNDNELLKIFKTSLRIPYLRSLIIRIPNTNHIPAERANEEALLLPEFEDAGPNEFQNLKSALEKLVAACELELGEMERNSASVTVISSSAAMKTINSATKLVESLLDNGKEEKEKLNAINTFNREVGRTATGNILRAVAVVAFAAIGFVVGAGIGFVVGYILGSWTGPGAALTALFGVTKGSMMGAALGLKLAVSITGVCLSAGSASFTGYNLFKSNERESAVADMVSAAKSFAQEH